jgi:hypothetical protein
MAYSELGYESWKSIFLKEILNSDPSWDSVIYWRQLTNHSRYWSLTLGFCRYVCWKVWFSSSYEQEPNVKTAAIDIAVSTFAEKFRNLHPAIS